MRIYKLTNGNVSFTNDNDEPIFTYLPTGAFLQVEGKQVKIWQDGAPIMYIDPKDVTATQVVPSATVPFSGSASDLMILLSLNFFEIPSGSAVGSIVAGDGILVDNTNPLAPIVSDDWTRVTDFDILNADILAAGNTPIVLLPALAATEYYEYEGYLEYEGNDYTLADLLCVVDSSFNGTVFKNLIDGLNTGKKAIYFSNMTNILADAISGASVAVAQAVGSAISLTTWNSSNPSVGTGSIKVKDLKYKIKTFG